MKFSVLTIFPDIIRDYGNLGMLGRALKKKLITIEAHDLRDYATDKHRTVDDTPYGGGAGMVLKIEPIYRAITAIKKKLRPKPRVILLSARGKTWNQALARKYAEKGESLVFICGRYEGVDERINAVIDEEISIGDYVLTGGELGALVIIDSIARLRPGVLGNTESLATESHSVPGVLEHPHYTKPEAVRLGNKVYRVPKVLLSGHHGEIEEWRRKKLKVSSKGRRPKKA